MQEESEILHLFSFLFRIFADNIQILLAHDQETTSITISGKMTTLAWAQGPVVKVEGGLLQGIPSSASEITVFKGNGNTCGHRTQ